MLRGTRTRYNKAAFASKPTLQNQISALRNQVSKNKPETIHYRGEGTYDASSAGRYISNVLITQNVINWTQFRNNITGDKWRNLSLDISLGFMPSEGANRVLVYVPRKSGQRYTPSSQELNAYPDPSAFWVISDDLIQKQDAYPTGEVRTVYKKKINLRGLHTIYNSDSTVLEKGEIILCVIGDPMSGLGNQYEYGYHLKLQNI